MGKRIVIQPHELVNLLHLEEGEYTIPYSSGCMEIDVRYYSTTYDYKELTDYGIAIVESDYRKFV